MTLNEKPDAIDGNRQKTKKIAVNTLVLFLRMLVLTVVNLYSVKLVLNGLGVVSYGVYNAIAALVTSGSCLSVPLAMSTQRFYSYAIGENNCGQLRQIFSASMLLTALIAAGIAVVFSLIGPWFISNHMTIPATHVTSAVCLFFLSLAAFAFSLLQIPFLAAIFAHEEMGVFALFSTIDCLLKLLLACFLYHATADRLVFYGAGLALISFVTFFCYTVYARRRYQECRYNRNVDGKLMRELMSFSGWTFYGTLTSIATVQGSALALNVFFGPVTNVAFGIGNQIYNAMNSLANSTVVAFRPAMIKSFAGKDYDYLGKMFSSGNKMIFYLLLILVIPLSVDTENVLAIWLGEANVNGETILFARLYMIYAILLALHNPVSIIIHATGKIRNYTLFVETAMLSGFLISIILFYMGSPSYWLMLSLIAACAVAHALRLVFLHKSYGKLRIRPYFTEFVVPALIISFICTSISLFAAEEITTVMPLLHIIEVGIVSTILILTCVLSFGVTKAERKQIVSFLSNRLKSR